ncbi:MAG: ammonia-forming cytochrome c nitrite reductase subunit c552 [Coriobacteriales bacterium]|jgi:nitrite reductase (cytochrome c-552)|nr:ammonia-forming cytochrome c nitrite reductase subunit c552 [Coriobacteriales bacterium]
MKRQKFIVGGIVVLLFSALVAGYGLMGCSPQSSSTPSQAASSTGATTSSTSQESVSSTTKTMQQWGLEFPLQYNSYATVKINPVDKDKEGHFSMKTKELAPILKDERGYKPLKSGDEQYYTIDWLTYNDTTGEWIVDDSKVNVVAQAKAYTKGCFSCRSSKYQEIEAREGVDIYKQPLDAEYIAEINGQEWDCALCHANTPEDPADSQLVYFINGSGDAYDEMDAGERVCGQCHSTMNHFSENHYRYGFEVDGIYKSKFEQGQTSTDEKTGITTASGIYLPDLEMVQTSTMRKMGVTCVTCHMPEDTDNDSGQTYTTHNASGSPLENEKSLEKCLTCHKSQGISDTTAMKAMVRDLQARAKETLTALSDRCKATKEAIGVAVEAGNVDAAKLDVAREKYSLAYAYYQVALGDPNIVGAKIAHNPEKTWEYSDTANSLLDEVDAALS